LSTSIAKFGIVYLIIFDTRGGGTKADRYDNYSNRSLCCIDAIGIRKYTP